MLAKFLLIIKLVIFCQLINFLKNSSIKVRAIDNFENPQCMAKHRLSLEKPDDIVFLDFEKNNSINDMDFDEVPNETILENDGHMLLIHLKFNDYDIVPTVKINLETVIGVKGKYRVEFLFFQWFEEVAPLLIQENVTFPAEFNALFYNVEAKSFEHALDMDKAIIILTFAIEVNPLKPDSFEILQENLKHVREPHSKISIPSKSLNNWLSGDMQYFYIYEGTFRNYCQTKVLWLDFVDMVTITPDIVQDFQKLKSLDSKDLMQEVIRPAIKPKGKVFTNLSPNQIVGGTPSLTFYYIEDPRESSADILSLNTLDVLLGLFSLFLINI